MSQHLSTAKSLLSCADHQCFGKIQEMHVSRRIPAWRRAGHLCSRLRWRFTASTLPIDGQEFVFFHFWVCRDMRFPESSSSLDGVKKTKSTPHFFSDSNKVKFKTESACIMEGRGFDVLVSSPQEVRHKTTTTRTDLKLAPTSHTNEHQRTT